MNFAPWRPSVFVIRTLIALPMLVTATAAPAEMIVYKTITYFSIGGTTTAELDHELQTRGPEVKTTGTRHPGATRIKFGGDVTYLQKGGTCRVAKARVTVSTHIMLPRWKNRRSAKPGLALLWDTLSGDIRRHEERHAEIARTHGREMEQALAHLPAESTCHAMQEAVSSLSAMLILSHDRDQARFDRVEAVNFESRMIRLLRGRISAKPVEKHL